MQTEEIKDLYRSFRRAHATALSIEEFVSLVNYLPALLVVACDGVVDEEEWVYVEYLAKFLSNRHGKEHTTEQKAQLFQCFFQDLVYLSEHLSEWEKPFLHALKSYLHNKEELKDEMLDILQMFAEASDGISTEEEEMIEKLSEILGLN